MQDLRVNSYFILTPTGDTIIYYNPNETSKRLEPGVFFQMKSKNKLTPIFCVNGLTYYWTKKLGFYYTVTTYSTSSPILVSEFLESSIIIFKDYLGSLSEASLKANFFLIEEILTEICTFGFIQEGHTKALKSRIVNKPIVTDGPGFLDTIRNTINSNLRSGDSANQSILSTRINLFSGSSYTNANLDAPTQMSVPSKKTAASSFSDLIAKTKELNFNISKKSEIYIDVFESVEAVLDSEGNPLLSRLVGGIFTRSFLYESYVASIQFTPIKTGSVADEVSFGGNESSNRFGHGEEHLARPAGVSGSTLNDLEKKREPRSNLLGGNFSIKENALPDEPQPFGRNRQMQGFNYSSSKGNTFCLNKIPSPQINGFPNQPRTNAGLGSGSQGKDPFPLRGIDIQTLNASGLFGEVLPASIFAPMPGQKSSIIAESATVKPMPSLKIGGKYEIDADALSLGDLTFSVEEGEQQLFEYSIDIRTPGSEVEIPLGVQIKKDVEEATSSLNYIVTLGNRLETKGVVQNISFSFFVPETPMIRGVSCRFREAKDSFSYDYFEESRLVVWKIKQIPVQGMETAKFCLNLNLPAGCDRNQKKKLIDTNMGSAKVKFECMGGVPSLLKIQKLKLLQGDDKTLSKWVRYHTHVSSLEVQMSS